ncbi:Mitochondrial distribution and morphology protein 34 [Mycena venus]|uniref:Mitochondrial distribution and morphology protein 34 n=1 Tax=Mycena venus TaxID=2733690 RepID=A0A8H7CYA4_9AGAR|nr:Mitochondrial distribution and morphology protein 34 [Mycena venus]
MSFTFHWPRFSDQFHYDAIQMLNTALNKGNKPPIIADKIEVVELEMGTQPPELEIRDIGDLTMDQFRGIFRLTYAGDAHLVLKTKVQANPLNHKQPDIHLMTGSRGMLAAKQALVVPMLLRLSHFKLSSYVVLVVSKQKGITLVFKTDPLQSVDINSTFDSIVVIQMFIQREIEGQLRQMFREDLPGIIHRLSQQWVKAKVETPTAGLTQRNVGALNYGARGTLSSAPPSLTRHNVNVFNSASPAMPRTSSISRTNLSRRTTSPSVPVTPSPPR